MPRIKGLKQGLAGALALGAAAAVPVVVTSSQAQQGLTPWQPRGAGGSTADGADADAAAAGHSAAAPPDWTLSRVLEEVLQQVRQLALGGSEADEEADSEEAEGAWEDAVPAAHSAERASSLGPDGPAAAAATLHDEHQQHAHGGRQHRRQGRDFLSARRLAAERPEEVRHLRQMTLAELARLRAEDGSDGSSSSSSSSSAAPASRRQQAQAQSPQQQQVAQQAGEAAPQQQQAAGHGPLPARFTDAELVRFAIMQGLLQASTPAEREAKLREGAAAAARTALWLEQHPFSSEDELTRFAHLVRWEGPDAAGRPVLRILIGAAVTECRGNAALAFANAIITHMEQGVSSRLHDAPAQPVANGSGGSPSPLLQFVISQPAEAQGLGQRSGSLGSGSRDPAGAGQPGAAPSTPPAAAAAAAAAGSQPVPAAGSAAPSPSPEQIVVLMDCRGASTLNAARISWVFKAVASSLSHHYPGRLHELVLLDLPVVLGWMVKGVKQLVHPDTRSKFRVVHAGQAPAAQQAQQVGQQQPAATAQQVPAAEAPPAGKPRWLRGKRRAEQQQQQEQQLPPALIKEQQGEQQAGGARTEQQLGEQDGQQEAGPATQPEEAAAKAPHRRRRMQRASKRKQPEQEEAAAAQPSEPREQPPAAEQQGAPEPAAKQPARQQRQRGRLAEQQTAQEEQEAAAAAAGQRGQ